MSDTARLHRIATELAAAATAHDQGRRVSLPVVQQADAAALINAMHAELDQAIVRRDAELGARRACSKGCSNCCKSPVLVNEGEAVAIAVWLGEPEHANARERFEVAYPRWRDSLGELLAPTAQPRSADETQAWSLRVLQRGAMCAFNDDGACAIYSVRPALCRKTHALDTNEYCGTDAGKVQYHQHAETETVYESQRPIKRALHWALRPKGRLELLCAAVQRLLGGPR